MRSGTVIAFIKVLDYSLPVRVQMLFPIMIEPELFAEIELLHPSLIMHPVKMLLPLYIWLAGLKVDVNKSNRVHEHVDRQETVLGFVKALNSIEPRGFR